ncbi:MAG: alpha/beta hydrolase [Chitinophagales bacterium]|nr:alpha/beta hydrolase [Chitinophagales bacterium]MDW8427045.1 alpha/beta hydrolase [Chitinophagales bacterium]
MKSLFSRRHFLFVSLALLVAIPLYYGYTLADTFLWSDRELQKFFRDKKYQPIIDTLPWQGRAIRFVSIGEDSLPVLFFIHGAPGSWTDYVRYCDDSLLLRRARLVAYDRPGYGDSNCGAALPSIEEQARLAAFLISLVAPEKPFVAIGHSYGGPIAARLAMYQPQHLRALVLIAPAIDPEKEKQFFVNDLLTAMPPLQRLLPCNLLSAYHEKMTHVSELKAIAPQWNRIAVPTHYVYGRRDRIVPPENVAYAQRMLHAPLYITEFADGDHFLPWTQLDSIRTLLLRLAETYF